jgi:hypothetical protein
MPGIAYAGGDMSEPEVDDAPGDEPMPLHLAGSRTRLAFYNHDRRTGLLAALGLLAVGTLVLWAIYRFVNS